MARYGSFGTTILLLLACCGFAAAGAQAEQPASTCVPEAGTYSDAHCKTKTGSGSFKLVETPDRYRTQNHDDERENRV